MASGELIDRAAAARLADELYGSAEIVTRFVADFIATWPSRFARVAESLDHVDVPELVAALLSIRSTSQMVGAVRLAQHTETLERAASEGDLAACRRGLPRLAAIGAETVRALQE
jgi:hypothetical protein